MKGNFLLTLSFKFCCFIAIRVCLQKDHKLTSLFKLVIPLILLLYALAMSKLIATRSWYFFRQGRQKANIHSLSNCRFFLGFISPKFSVLLRPCFQRKLIMYSSLISLSVVHKTLKEPTLLYMTWNRLRCCKPSNSSKCSRILIIWSICHHSSWPEIIHGASFSWLPFVCYGWSLDLTFDEHEREVTQNEGINHANDGNPIGPIDFTASHIVDICLWATYWLHSRGIPSNGIYKTCD